jgi:ADP-ribose pyrophosphatase YjhB (NUDIX family)
MSYLPPQHIRPIVICIFRRGDSIFVFEGYDSVKEQTFYRPLGGAIEFGELGAQAIVREMREEIQAEIINLRYLGALENIFVLEGIQGHEIILVYEADFVSQKFYEIEETTGMEDIGLSFKAMWKPLAEFDPGKQPLYPEGLLDLLR